MRTDVPLWAVDGRAFFTKEIDRALLANEIDVAVHSLKDVSTALEQGIELAAVLEREDPRDALISAHGRRSSPICRRVRASAPAACAGARSSRACGRTSCSWSCGATCRRASRSCRRASTTRSFSRPRGSSGSGSMRTSPRVCRRETSRRPCRRARSACVRAADDAEASRWLRALDHRADAARRRPPSARCCGGSKAAARCRSARSRRSSGDALHLYAAVCALDGIEAASAPKRSAARRPRRRERARAEESRRTAGAGRRRDHRVPAQGTAPAWRRHERAGAATAAGRRHARGSERWPVERAVAQPRPRGAAVAGHAKSPPRDTAALDAGAAEASPSSTGSSSPAATPSPPVLRALPRPAAGRCTSRQWGRRPRRCCASAAGASTSCRMKRTPARWSRRSRRVAKAGHARAVSRELARAADDREGPRATRRGSHAGRGLSHRARLARRRASCRSLDRARRDRRGDVREPVRGDRAGTRARQSGLRAAARRAPRPSPSARPPRARSTERGRAPVMAESATLARARRPPRCALLQTAWQRLDHGIPLATTAPPAPVRRLAAHGAGDAALRRRAHLSAVRRARQSRCASRSTSMPGVFQLSVDEVAKEAQSVADSGVPAVLLFAAPAHKDAKASAALDAERPRAAGHRAPSRRPCPKLHRVGGRVPLRRHRSRPLRARDAGRRHRQRHLRRNARAGVAHLRARRRGCRRAERHDGRPRARHPPAARPQRLLEHADRFLRGEIRVLVLWAVPRSRRIRAGLRRPPLLSDGSGERPRSAARSAAGSWKRARTW